MLIEAISARFNQAVSINGSSNHQWMHRSVKVLAVFIGACLIHNLWKKKHSQAAENVCELGVLKVVSYTIDVRNLEEIVGDIQEENQNLEFQVDELKKTNAELKNIADAFSETTARLKEDNAMLQQSIQQIRKIRVSTEKTISQLMEFKPHIINLTEKMAEVHQEVNKCIELSKEKRETFNADIHKLEEQLAILEQQKQEEQARHEKVMSSIPVR